MARTQRLSCTTSGHLPRTGGRACFWTGVAWQREWLHIVRGFHGVSKKISFSYTLRHYYCCCSFSYLIAVSSKLLLSQFVIFIFCDAHSPHHSIMKERKGEGRREWGRERGGEWATYNLEGFQWEHWIGEYHSSTMTNSQNTIHFTYLYTGR